VTTVIYHGHEVMIYNGYMDLMTGKTLTCTPGETYDITPVSAGSGIPADGRFTEVSPEEAEALPGEEEQRSGVTQTVTSDATGGKE
jgi:hypothetical protein